MKKMLTLLLLCLSFTLFGNQEECYEDCTNVESWYMHLGLGVSSIDYGNNMDNIKDIPGVEQTTVNIDIGVYIPLNQNLLVGGVIYGDGDRYSYQGEWVQVNTYVIGGSAMYFFNEINNGIFVRGDLGYTDANASNSDGDSDSLDDDQRGMGTRIAAGYALQLDPGYSLLFSLGYTHKGIADDNVKSYNFTVSFLF